jgi:hypothetical protein
MSASRRYFKLAGAMMLAVGWLAVSATAATMSCAGCHTNEVAQFTSSAHVQAGITCVTCHGGDITITDETAHVTANFQRPDNKRAIAELCASCHSDVRKMNPYGLPTDQFDRYKTSKHGEQLFGKNDQKVAVCTDCHGIHDILKAKSPQARVYPTNVPGTCGRCHSDKDLMAQYKLPADAVARYKTSEHGHMVLEKGDLSAPTCVTCHGNHGATPPGTAEVGQVCGKCHGRQRELFEKSPHNELAKVGAFNECVSCHSNHAIKKASAELFATACTECHKKDPKELGVRDALAGLITRSRTAYENAEREVRNATVRGLATDEEEMLLQEVKTQITQLEALQHTLALDQLQPVAARATTLTKQTTEDVAVLLRYEQWKREALIPIWSFLGTMAALFWAKRRQIERGGL